MAVRAVNGKARWGKTYKGFSVMLEKAGRTLTTAGGTVLTRACETWLQEVDSQWPRGEKRVQMNRNTGQTARTYGAYKSGYRGGDHYYPWYTGNLHDSMATRVAIGNRTVSIRQMAEGASVNQYAEGYGPINGHEWGITATSRGRYVFLPGLQAQLYIGVPYAAAVDEMPEHRGYVREFEKDFASTIEGVMNAEFGGNRGRNLYLR